MLREEIQLMWKAAAVLLGAALPLILLGKAVTSVCLISGILFGLLATKGTSLRSTVTYLLGSNVFRMLIAVYVAFSFSAAFGIDRAYAMEQLLQLFGLGLGGILLYIVIREMPSRDVQIPLRTLAVATIFVMTLSLVDAFLNDQRLSQALHGDNWEHRDRLNFMSTSLAVILPFFWAWLIKKDQEQEVLAHSFALPVAVVSFWVIFVCGGRAGWISGTVAALIFLWLAGTRHQFTLHGRHWLLSIFVVAIGPLLYGLARGMDTLVSRINPAMEKFGPGSGRLDIWEFAMSKIPENPVFGIGLNSFRKLSFDGVELASTMHPHNFVLQLLLETGIVGFAAVAAVALYVLYIFWKYAQGNLYGVAALCSYLAFWVGSLANTSIFHEWWLLFLIVPSLIGMRVGWSEQTHAR